MSEMMAFEIERLSDRRPSRVKVSTTLDLVGDCGVRPDLENHFERKYLLKVTIGASFFSTDIQLERKKRDAEQLVRNHLFRELFEIMDEIILEADSEEIRSLAVLAKDMMRGKER